MSNSLAGSGGISAVKETMSSLRRDCISGSVQGAKLGPMEKRGLVDAMDASALVLRLEEAELNMAASFLLVSLRLGCFFLGEDSMVSMPPIRLGMNQQPAIPLILIIEEKGLRRCLSSSS